MGKHSPYSTDLPDGRKVPYSILSRAGSGNMLFVHFRGPNGNRLEKSTGETGTQAARKSAVRIIHEAYCPPPTRLSLEQVAQELSKLKERVYTIELKLQGEQSLHDPYRI